MARLSTLKILEDLKASRKITQRLSYCFSTEVREALSKKTSSATLLKSSCKASTLKNLLWRFFLKLDHVFDDIDRFTHLKIVFSHIQIGLLFFHFLQENLEVIIMFETVSAIAL